MEVESWWHGVTLGLIVANAETERVGLYFAIAYCEVDH